MLVPLGIAFIVALIASTVVALTVTPVLCSYLIGKRENKETKQRKQRLCRSTQDEAWYGSALTFVLGHKKGGTGKYCRTICSGARLFLHPGPLVPAAFQ